MADPRKREPPLFPRWLVALAGIFLVGIGLYWMRGVLTPLFFAFLIAYMLDPVIDRFEARKVPRAVGIAVMLVIVLGALSTFVLLVVPAAVREAAEFFRELPATLEGWRAQMEPQLRELGIPVPSTMQEAMDQFHISSQELSKVAAPAGAALKWLLGGTASVVGAIIGSLMVPVFAAYLLHDFDHITAGIRDLVPGRWRPFVVDVARETDTVLGEFIRGQLIVMFALAVLYSVAYSLLGVRLAVLIGLIGGLVSFIPYVGGAVALGMALVMSLLDAQTGWGQLVGVVAVYAAIQSLEGFVITPKIVGDKVGLPAVWVLFALLVGGELFGFMGILLALPAAAIVKIFVVRGLAWYRKSAFFLAQDAPPSGRERVMSALLHEEGLPDAPAVKQAKAQASHPDEAEKDEDS